MTTGTWRRSDWASVVALAVMMTGPQGASAQRRDIDIGKSTMTVRVDKAGAFSAFAHDHEIAAPIAAGSVDVTGRKVELRVNANALKVRDPKGSEKDHEKIQSTMLGAEVLDAQSHPEIAFHSVSAEAAGAGAWTVKGNLTLHGQTHPVTVAVKEANGHFVGNAVVKQSEFGIAPIKVAGGTVRVKDDVKIEFDIQLAR